MTWGYSAPIKPWGIVLCTGLSATFLTLIFSGFQTHLLAWIALVPLLLVLCHSGPLRALLSSLAVGLIFFGAVMWWALAVKGVNFFNFSLVVLGNGLYFGVFGLFAYYFHKKLSQWDALTFPATWVMLEYLRSHTGFLSFPWGILGYSQYTVLPVAHISAFTGVYGVSFLVVTVNAVAAEIVHSHIFRSGAKDFQGKSSWSSQKTPIGILAGAVILLSASFLHGLPSSSKNGSSRNLKVALVQANVYAKENKRANFNKTLFSRYRQHTLEAADSGPDLIAWPSSSVPGAIPSDRVLVRMLSRLAKEAGAFLLIGSSGHEKLSRDQKRLDRFANSVYFFTPFGQIVGRYDKILLLPFDEYLPLRGYVKWPSWLVSSDAADAQPGEELTVFRTKNVRFGALICWENMFPDLFRKMASQGVDLMVSMTNEGFTDVPAAHYQMLAMNVFRAIENHVAIVRTATTGVSCIIEPSGRIIARVQDDHGNDVHVEGHLVRKVPVSPVRSFYSRYGDWFVYSLFAVFCGFVLWALFAKAQPLGRESA